MAVYAKTMKFTLFLMVSFFLGGCVTGTRQLDLSAGEIRDDKTAKTAKTAQGQIYLVEIIDSRQFEKRPGNPSTPSVDGTLAETSKEKLATLIGRQRNSFGKAMGDIALPNGGTVQGEVYKLLQQGLENRGYEVTNDSRVPLKLAVNIQKFWAWFSPGFWAISFESQIETGLHFQGEGVDKKFVVSGYGMNKGQVASDANWELTYKRAMDQYIVNLNQLLDSEGL